MQLNEHTHLMMHPETYARAMRRAEVLALHAKRARKAKRVNFWAAIGCYTIVLGLAVAICWPLIQMAVYLAGWRT